MRVKVILAVVGLLMVAAVLAIAAANRQSGFVPGGAAGKSHGMSGTW